MALDSEQVLPKTTMLRTTATLYRRPSRHSLHRVLTSQVLLRAGKASLALHSAQTLPGPFQALRRVHRRLRRLHQPLRQVNSMGTVLHLVFNGHQLCLLSSIPTIRVHQASHQHLSHHRHMRLCLRLAFHHNNTNHWHLHRQVAMVSSSTAVQVDKCPGPTRMSTHRICTNSSIVQASTKPLL